MTCSSFFYGFPGANWICADPQPPQPAAPAIPRGSLDVNQTPGGNYSVDQVISDTAAAQRAQTQGFFNSLNLPTLPALSLPALPTLNFMPLLYSAAALALISFFVIARKK
jgi:hypothetical protein